MYIWEVVIREAHYSGGHRVSKCWQFIIFVLRVKVNLNRENDKYFLRR